MGRQVASQSAAGVLALAERREFGALVRALFLTFGEGDVSFPVRASLGVESAGITLQADGQRVLLYNDTFIRTLSETAPSSWAVVFLFAHEVGHEFAGHADPSRIRGADGPMMELMADELAGFLLGRVGASLTDSRRAFTAATSLVRSLSPNQDACLARIEQGWRKACGEGAGCGRKLPNTASHPAPAGAVVGRRG